MLNFSKLKLWQLGHFLPSPTSSPDSAVVVVVVGAVIGRVVGGGGGGGVVEEGGGGDKAGEVDILSFFFHSLFS